MSASLTPAAREALFRAGALTPAGKRGLETLLGLGPEALKEAGYRYAPRLHLWMRRQPPEHPRHRALVTEAWVAWLKAGHAPGTFVIEPRLPYRSPAGGPRHLDPDALLAREGRVWALEVDRGTEGVRDLLHKWWRYREFGAEASPLALLVLAPPSRRHMLEVTLAKAGVAARLVTSLAELVGSEEPAITGMCSGASCLRSSEESV